MSVLKLLLWTTAHALLPSWLPLLLVGELAVLVSVRLSLSCVEGWDGRRALVVEPVESIVVDLVSSFTLEELTIMRLTIVQTRAPVTKALWLEHQVIQCHSTSQTSRAGAGTIETS